jgi:hypothetical protein
LDKVSGYTISYKSDNNNYLNPFEIMGMTQWLIKNDDNSIEYTVCEIRSYTIITYAYIPSLSEFCCSYPTNTYCISLSNSNMFNGNIPLYNFHDETKTSFSTYISTIILTGTYTRKSCSYSISSKDVYSSMFSSTTTTVEAIAFSIISYNTVIYTSTIEIKYDYINTEIQTIVNVQTTINIKDANSCTRHERCLTRINNLLYN